MVKKTKLDVSAQGTRRTRRKSSDAVTLQDVAKSAGVAPMTVSRFLNNHPNVTEKTARKVRAAIQKLGYAPNYAARVLMGQPSNVIGLIVVNLADSFFAEMAHDIQNYARSMGYLVWVAASNGDRQTEASIIQQMKHQKVDGILLVPTSRSEEIYLAEDNPPIVTLDRPVAGLSAVTVDNRQSARDAVEHLIQHGYKRIACVGADGDAYTVAERVAGYEDALRAHSLKPAKRLDCPDFATTCKALEELLSSEPRVDAIFTTNNASTVRTVHALNEMDIAFPSQIALFGFDKSEFIEGMRPRISVISQPAAEMGRLATRLLFERIRATEKTPPTTTVLPATMLIGETCGCKRTSAKRNLAA